jgi:hypothetical protein
MTSSNAVNVAFQRIVGLEATTKTVRISMHQADYQLWLDMCAAYGPAYYITKSWFTTYMVRVFFPNLNAGVETLTWSMTYNDVLTEYVAYYGIFQIDDTKLVCLQYEDI